MVRLYRAYRQFKPFTDSEAWMLFKLAAFAEAIGWTILVTGIILTDYVFPGNRTPVMLAGRTHGIMFMTYIVAVIVLSPSLGWKWKRTVIGGLLSAPPLGSLAFELWNSRARRNQDIKKLSRVVLYQQAVSL